ncbi:WD40 repeat-containing protein [Cavenderia fasciculata]|uniref:WD40 repeat-containing protein n=1 Tax=Cavenderia fasciculata TaxID=261658 RepID=F4QB96_CACFS|nr:WD40 repeat-containing protein [Cavenderia fasciculata]EGG14868.1 WD40 repeat-containing protein [Cavenderia fasciculata]|eukprot:XP_004351384.1 WD40 repeat-containing protein [Cavenderia fasciculata]
MGWRFVQMRSPRIYNTKQTMVVGQSGGTNSQGWDESIDRMVNQFCLQSIRTTRSDFYPGNPIQYTLALDDAESKRLKLHSKIYDEYRDLPISTQDSMLLDDTSNNLSSTSTSTTSATTSTSSNNIHDEKRRKLEPDNSLVLSNKQNNNNNNSRSLMNIEGQGQGQQQGLQFVKPEWHAPWKLMRVVSGHTGWVRCVGFGKRRTQVVAGGPYWCREGVGDIQSPPIPLFSGRRQQERCLFGRFASDSGHFIHWWTRPHHQRVGHAYQGRYLSTAWSCRPGEIAAFTGSQPPAHLGLARLDRLSLGYSHRHQSVDVDQPQKGSACHGHARQGVLICHWCS